MYFEQIRKMKFKLDVQNRKIAWPTQRKFDKKKWEDAAVCQVLCKSSGGQR
jgi:hypothetical protein